MIVVIDFINNLRFSARHPAVKYGVFMLALVAVMMLIISAVFWWPQKSAVTALNHKLSAERLMLAGLSFDGGLLPAYQTASHEIAAVEKKLRRAVHQSDLIKLLSDIARQCDVTILSETYVGEKTAEDHVVLQNELSLVGDYSSIRKFIFSIVQLPGVTVVDEVQIEQARENPGFIKVRLRMSTHYSPTGDKGTA